MRFINRHISTVTNQHMSIMEAVKTIPAAPATEEKPIPKALIYEEMDGKPIYYKGYQKVLSGEVTIESIIGSSELQTYIVSTVLRFLYRNLPADQFFIGTNEPGLHLSLSSNLSNDILIYRKADLSISRSSIYYFSKPPLVAIEVDVKATPENFASELDYFNQKTGKLLEFGVQKVLWITTASRRITVATNIPNTGNPLPGITRWKSLKAIPSCWTNWSKPADLRCKSPAPTEKGAFTSSFGG